MTNINTQRLRPVAPRHRSSRYHEHKISLPFWKYTTSNIQQPKRELTRDVTNTRTYTLKSIQISIHKPWFLSPTIALPLLLYAERLPLPPRHVTRLNNSSMHLPRAPLLSSVSYHDSRHPMTHLAGRHRPGGVELEGLALRLYVGSFGLRQPRKLESTVTGMHHLSLSRKPMDENAIKI